MAIIIPPPPIKSDDKTVWNGWYQQIKSALTQLSDSLKWSSIDKSGSNITDIQTRNHNDLGNIQGGGLTEKYHITSAQATAINSGITVVINTAKLTAGGTNGSMTFTNGILTAQTQAT